MNNIRRESIRFWTVQVDRNISHWSALLLLFASIAAMVFFFAHTPVRAEQSDDLLFRIDGQSITITGYSNLCMGVIPSVIDGLPVRVIGERAFAGSDFLKYQLPEGLTTIEREAFADCGSMTGIMIPSSVTLIGERAFANSGLLEVFFIGNAPTIHETAFENCSSSLVIRYRPEMSGFEPTMSGFPTRSTAEDSHTELFTWTRVASWIILFIQLLALTVQLSKRHKENETTVAQNMEASLFDLAKRKRISLAQKYGYLLIIAGSFINLIFWVPFTYKNYLIIYTNKMTKYYEIINYLEGIFSRLGLMAIILGMAVIVATATNRFDPKRLILAIGGLAQILFTLFYTLGKMGFSRIWPFMSAFEGTNIYNLEITTRIYAFWTLIIMAVSIFDIEKRRFQLLLVLASALFPIHFILMFMGISFIPDRILALLPYLMFLGCSIYAMLKRKIATAMSEMT